MLDQRTENSQQQFLDNPPARYSSSVARLYRGGGALLQRFDQPPPLAPVEKSSLPIKKKQK